MEVVHPKPHKIACHTEIKPGIPQDLRYRGRWACQSLSKAFDISGASAWIAPDIQKALAILSVTEIEIAAVEREDLKQHWKSEKDHPL